MKYFISAIAILLTLALLSGCSDSDDSDTLKRTYAEVGCMGILERDNDNYKCGVEVIDRSKLNYSHTVTVNRRTGTVAFEGHILGECRVADFDAWECVEGPWYSRTLGGEIVGNKIIRSGQSGGGYREQWCSLRPEIPENCRVTQQYYGIPPFSDISRIGNFLGDKFCSWFPDDGACLKRSKVTTP